MTCCHYSRESEFLVLDTPVRLICTHKRPQIDTWYLPTAAPHSCIANKTFGIAETFSIALTINCERCC